ncbi:hypothetical protein HFM85_04430 [Blautia schinkii]|uniref:hypothetical protein n=1 Tax=Blautia schinkii TaxID=180164 RepID=UPI00156FA505|nr:MULTISPECIES: hypothetical protein [Clostridia]NSG81652.1 hypothetical protein [Blautia schinkii]NSK22252.1 hypothetical protein [Blautia schinkii]NSK31517.1 hypothetical protein [Blautia schinkii]NSK48042.1 hypothetical protein [Blautia schinkii]
MRSFFELLTLYHYCLLTAQLHKICRSFLLIRAIVTVQGLTGLKKTDGVNWETVKAIGFLYPNILDTLSKGTAEKTINTVFSAEHDYPQYKKIKIRHFLQ